MSEQTIAELEEIAKESYEPFSLAELTYAEAMAALADDEYERAVAASLVPAGRFL